MFRRIFPYAASSALLAVLSSAQNTIESLTFGRSGPISPNGRAIPGWHLSGEGHIPQILSDRVILTPPVPGSTRGALWADESVTQQYWTAELAFRASGQERGSGNLQIWFVKDGRSAIGSNSVYTVSSFDGLVLAIDQHGGRGMLRGFLNDGSTSYAGHHNVDSLSFGHCDFPYRNLGRPSRVRVAYDAQGFSVHIDDQECFSTNQVNLPVGYYLGVTAATAENPDSFEVSHFVTTTTSAILRDEPVAYKAADLSHQQEQHRLPNAPEQLADADADTFRRQEEQFADLHNRLQGLSHQVANIFGEFERISKSMNDRHNEILARMPKSNDETMSSLNRRLDSIERIVEKTAKDIESRDYRQHFTSLQHTVEGLHGGMTDKLPETLHKIVTGSAPRMGTFVFVVVVVQVMLLGAYALYRRRRDNAPKKYL